MATQSEQYRQRAMEAEERAEQTRDPEIKASWRRVANDWRDMADQAESNRW